MKNEFRFKNLENFLSFTKEIRWFLVRRVICTSGSKKYLETALINPELVELYSKARRLKLLCKKFMNDIKGEPKIIYLT